MAEEALGSGQVGQPASPEPQVSAVTEQGGTVETQGTSAPQTEQPLSLTQSQLNQMIVEAMNSQKQSWMDEFYQNTQSMNDKYEKRLNDTIAAFEKAGIKTDKVSAAKYLREQDRQAQAQAQAQPQIEPAYQQFLQRFGARNPSDQRLQGAYSLERELGVQLNRDDPEYTEFFCDPNKRWGNAYQFVRDYERALTKKKERSAENPQGNVAGMPSISGNGKNTDRITMNMPASEILDRGLAELRNKR